MSEGAFTLTELLIALALMVIVTGGAFQMLQSGMRASACYDDDYLLYQDALLAMKRMSSGLKSCTYIHFPNSYRTTRSVLAFSGDTNADNDFYFDDPAFPRVTCDFSADVTADGAPGILGWDDNGDGWVDYGPNDSDDEGYMADEDPVDGIDNDGDGMVDEDPGTDMNGDGRPGLAGVDDDSDGNVDEGSYQDDDEDGRIDEDPMVPRIFSVDTATKTLQELTAARAVVQNLCTHVTAFSATYVDDDQPDTAPRVLLSLTITGDDAKVYTFAEYVYLRNVLERCGKRVR